MIRLENVLKISLQDVLKTSWRCLEDVFQDVLKTFWRRLQNVLKMSWRRFCKTSSRRLQDLWPRRIYWSWPRRLEDVMLRQTYSSWSRCLEDVFKTSSEVEDEKGLRDAFIKTNVCWELHRTNQGSNFLGNSFSKTDNVGALIQIRRKSQPQHLKRWFFLKNWSSHYHINSTSVIRPVKLN